MFKIDYKQKYINFRNIIGGSIKTARIYFKRNIKDKYTNIENDNYLRTQLIDFDFPRSEDLVNYDQEDLIDHFKLNTIFDEIIRFTTPKTIDFVCQLYLNGKLGEPNSLENIGRLNDNINNFIILKNNNKHDDELLNDSNFESLNDLEEFIHSKNIELEEIENKKNQKNTTKTIHRRIKEEGAIDYC
jgi:hypothetical protein